MIRNSSGRVAKPIHKSFFDDSVRFVLFLRCSINLKKDRQLTWKISTTTDKSFSFVVFHRSFSCIVNLIRTIAKGGLGPDLSILEYYRSLLLCEGVEPNPGPGARTKVELVSQNCRGLSDATNLISLLRKSYNSPHSSKILCLQETHQINRFALDNHFKGSFVLDNGERDQRGTAILIPELYEISMS